ncbi:hypothetical protein GRS66_008523, partial [Saccharomyces pastorianus]
MVKSTFTSDLKVDGELIVAKSEATYEGTAFDVSGATFEVSGNFSAEESAATLHPSTPSLLALSIAP